MNKIVLTGGEALGIELGSTRIKAVLVDPCGAPIASGSYGWENKLKNGYWSYELSDVKEGVAAAYAALDKDAYEKSGLHITRIASLGVSAMMHGYLAFDENGKQLAEFRTWRNTSTAQAAQRLTQLFDFNIPQRWSVAHFYQAILNNEEHIPRVKRLTTLAGYVHYLLTGCNVLGVGDASGMFPINSDICDYDEGMLQKFDSLPEIKERGISLKTLLPRVLSAGQSGGALTESGARLLNPSGRLQPGALCCPPEGDAGTGMAATNSVRQKTGNVSAGTSIFSMVVLQKPLSAVHEEIDIVTTPTGAPVAMVHCNNCCTDLDRWVDMLYELLCNCGADITKPRLYDLLYAKALEGSADCGGIVNYNYFSGEPVAHAPFGVPMLFTAADSKLNIADFFRSQIFSALATLKLGMEILDGEGVEIECINAHGGLFKSPVTGQRLLAGALETPVAVTQAAGEGGAWGIALLALYAADTCGMSLEDYLDSRIFSSVSGSVEKPVERDVLGFKKYMKMFKKGMPAELSAAAAVNDKEY